MYNHILLPTDGSELSLQGVRHGLALAKSDHSKVTIILVQLPYPLMHPATGQSWREAQQEIAQTAIKAVNELAKQAGVEVSVVHKTNESPAEAIVEAAAETGSDLIVMASHGRRGVKRMLLGSQTAEVVRTSSVPVLVVH